LVIFGANWCYDCHVLDAALHSQQIEPLVAAYYHVVHVNIGDGDANRALVERYQIPIKKDVPIVAVIDSTGNLVDEAVERGNLSLAQIDVHDLVRFLVQWEP
jgi:hypothetical protein